MTRDPRLGGALVAALLAGAAGCRSKPAPAPPSPVVATFAGGEITAADVNQAVLDLPPQRRQPEDGDFLAWYERLARGVALERLLLGEAREAALEQGKEFQETAAEARKQAAVDEFLEKDVPPPASPSEADVRAFYDEHRDQFQSTPARLVQHLFRRVAPGADSRPVMAAMQRLRARIVAGADFAALAAEQSESESRHQSGVLGWVSPGQLAPELDRILFGLKVGVPSEPIPTREGVHLFLVSAERPRKTFSFPEVRPLIQHRIQGERWEASIRERVGDALPPGSFVPNEQELGQILASEDPQALVLQIGDLRLSRLEFQRRQAAQAAREPSMGSMPAAVFLSLIRQRELLYRHCVKEGLDRRPGVEARWRRLMDRERVGVLVRRKLAEAVEPGRLEDYYRANRLRFSEPLRLRVEKLVVPLGPGANEAMVRLEQARQDLDQGRQTLASLAAALGGSVEAAMWGTPSELARKDPRGAALALRLQPGRHSTPYRTEKSLVMVRLMERQEPEPLPFEKARERVKEDYLASHRHELYAAMATERLARAKFQLVREHLEEMLKRTGMAPGDGAHPQ